MEISMCGNLIVGNRAPGVRVVRIAQPDLGGALDGGRQAHHGELFQELYDTVLATLGEGETLVLNVGLVESFPPAFYGFLAWVRQVVRLSKARLILCRLAPESQQTLLTASFSPPFAIAQTEEEAIRFATV